MGWAAGIAFVMDAAADDLHLDRRVSKSPPQSRDRALCAGYDGGGRSVLSWDAELRHASLRSPRGEFGGRVRSESAAAKLLDGDSSALALHRLRQHHGSVRFCVGGAD